MEGGVGGVSLGPCHGCCQSWRGPSPGCLCQEVLRLLFLWRCHYLHLGFWWLCPQASSLSSGPCSWRQHVLLAPRTGL